MRKIRIYFFILALSITQLANSQSIQEGLNFVKMEQYNNARKTFSSLATSAPQNPENQYYMGNFLIKMAAIDTSANESLDSAIVFFNKGIQADPKFALNYVGLGTVSYLKGSWDDAASNFKKATEMGRKNAQVYSKITEAYLYKGKKDVSVAIPQIEKAQQLDSKNTDIVLLVGDAYLLADQGSASRAIKQYDMALKMNPKLAEAHVKGGKIYLQARNYEEALKYYNKAIEVDPTFSPAYRERAELYFKLKGYRDKAPAEYKKYLQMSDGNYKSKVRYAVICFTNGNYPDAIDQINILAKENPNDRILYRLLGYCNYEMGASNKDTVMAKSNYVSGLKNMEMFFKMTTDTNRLIPSDYEYYGKLLLKTGNDTLGSKYMLRVVGKDSSQYEIYNDLAKITNDKKKFKKSAEYYTMYYKYKKPGLNDLLTWGRAYYSAADYVKADTIFSSLVRLKPDEVLGYKWRALANARQDGEATSGKAVTHYEKYIELAAAKDVTKYKNDIIAGYKYIGKYYLNAKKIQKSKEYWKKILELDPSDADARMVMANLK